MLRQRSFVIVIGILYRRRIRAKQFVVITRTTNFNREPLTNNRYVYIRNVIITKRNNRYRYVNNRNRQRSITLIIVRRKYETIAD